MRLLILLILLLCISCIPNESQRQNSPFPQIAIPLEKYVIGLPINSSGSATEIKCDSLYSRGTYNHQVGVVVFDNIPVWADPIKKDVIAYLNFADTVSLLALYLNNCASEMYYKIQTENCSAYTLERNIKDIYHYGKDLPGVYFKAAESVVGSDSIAAKKFINLFESRYALDTVSYDYEGEGGSHLLSGHAASLVLQFWLYAFQEDIEKEFSQGLKIVRDKSLNELRSNVIGQMLRSADDQLDNTTLAADDIRKNYSLLKILSSEEMAANVILKRWKILRSISGEQELLNILLGSSNKVVELLGMQMQSVLAIGEGKLDVAKDILLAAWRKHPDVTRRTYDDYTQFSLVPSNVTIDSLLLRTHDYPHTLSFIKQLQKHLSIRDTTLNNFLDSKKKRLCLQSDCPQPINNYDDGKISKIEITVNKNASLRNGVHGKEVRRFPAEIKGKILSEYTNYDSGPRGQHLVKIETDEGIFWVKHSDTRRVFNRLLFSPSQKNDLITDPVLKEALPLPSARTFLITYVNDDNIPDLIGIGDSKYAIDGKTTKPLWDISENSLDVTLTESDMYIPQHNLRLLKRSIRNEFVWELQGNIPGSYIAFQHPVIRYHDNLFVFTVNGLLLEINDNDGSLLNTYKLPGVMSGKSALHGKNLYFIGRTEDPYKPDTVYSINFGSREVMPLFALSARGSGNVQVADNSVYVQTAQLIQSFDQNNGSALSSYKVDANVRNFIIEQNHLIAWNGQSIKTYTLDNNDPVWTIGFPQMLNPNIVVKGDIVYASSHNQLYLLSLTNGDILKKISLPFEVHYDGAMKYYDKKLLISARDHLMIIENR